VTRPADYSADDLRQQLGRLPLSRGDVIFSHSNLGFFGRAAGVSGADDLCQMFFDVLMERLGGTGTIVVPTFTYSFPRQKVFNPGLSPSGMGVFAEWIRRHPDARRSIDPSYSVAAVGDQAEFLTASAPENSFGRGSFFGRFHEIGGRVLNLNFDAGSTFLHYVERELNCTYRFDKTFEGVLEVDNTRQMARNTIYVRYLSSEATEPVFTAFDALARSKNLFRVSPLGRGEIGAITAADCYDLLRETFPSRPWILTKAEKLGGMPPLVAEQSYQSSKLTIQG